MSSPHSSSESPTEAAKSTDTPIHSKASAARNSKNAQEFPLEKPEPSRTDSKQVQISNNEKRPETQEELEMALEKAPRQSEAAEASERSLDPAKKVSKSSSQRYGSLISHVLGNSSLWNPSFNLFAPQASLFPETSQPKTPVLPTLFPIAPFTVPFGVPSFEQSRIFGEPSKAPPDAQISVFDLASALKQVTYPPNFAPSGQTEVEKRRPGQSLDFGITRILDTNSTNPQSSTNPARQVKNQKREKAPKLSLCKKCEKEAVPYLEWSNNVNSRQSRLIQELESKIKSSDAVNRVLSEMNSKLNRENEELKAILYKSNDACQGDPSTSDTPKKRKAQTCPSTPIKKTNIHSKTPSTPK